MTWEKITENIEPTKPKLIDEPVTVCMADIEAQTVEWLWPGRVPRAKLTLLVGDPGLGKSMLTLDMAARVSSGRAWPDRPGEHVQAGGVLLLSGEDDPADTVKPRLLAAGADCKRVVVLQGWRTLREDGSGGEREHAVDLSHLHVIDEAISRMGGCKLLVIDPVSCFMGKADDHRNGEVRALLAGLAALAGRRRVAIVVVTHMRKTAGKAIYSALGSLAFAAAARACWAVARDPEDAAHRVFIPIKMNLSADLGGLRFKVMGSEIGSPVISWSEKPVNLRADDVLGDEGSGRRRGAAREQAEAFLRQALADGPREAGELEDAAEEVGISGSTLDRAARRLGVQKAKTGGRGDPWIWSLEDPSPKASDPDTRSEAFEDFPGDAQRYQNAYRVLNPLNGNGREPGDGSEEAGA